MENWRKSLSYLLKTSVVCSFLPLSKMSTSSCAYFQTHWASNIAFTSVFLFFFPTVPRHQGEAYASLGRQRTRFSPSVVYPNRRCMEICRMLLVPTANTVIRHTARPFIGHVRWLILPTLKTSLLLILLYKSYAWRQMVWRSFLALKTAFV